MNISSSAWNNGCESGWTSYLDESYRWQNTNDDIAFHSNYSTTPHEEDLSMVSDASSGPLQDNQHRQCLFTRTHKMVVGENKSKKASSSSKEYKNKPKYEQEHHSKWFDNCENNLDDTASSRPALNYSKVYGYVSHEHFMGFSHNLSPTHFEGNSAYNNQYGFCQSSHPENSDYAEPSYSKGRR